MSVKYINTGNILESKEDFDKITGFSCGCIGCLNDIYETPYMFNIEELSYNNNEINYEKFIKKHNRMRINRAS
jgi:hypothetical protein